MLTVRESKNALVLCGLWIGLMAQTIATAQSQLIAGQFALQGQTAQTEGHLQVTSVAGKPLEKRLDLWLTEPGKPQPIRSYQVEMTKKLHLIVVSSDFQSFMHEHPVLGNDGHLTLLQDFPRAGSYMAFADGLPNQLPHQVFRFQFDVGGPSESRRNLKPTGMGVEAGPYEVDLSSVRVRAGVATSLDVTILKDGKPAKDLHPYLGVPAHAVFLNAQDLSYVHVHPMAMNQMTDMSKDPPPMPEDGPSPADLMLHLGLQEPGIYKLWLQFRGGAEVYIAEFTVNAI